ncbi:hypothetical protein [Sphaerisporangium fuscum]|uniref:hypothetical protein n=1 Tax=Sphaerisporangium fuscum TaxID=2835868 RepID=UPI0027E258B3|nr:hypothetical protein [Sphaerisporangium fuscum]
MPEVPYRNITSSRVKPPRVPMCAKITAIAAMSRPVTMNDPRVSITIDRGYCAAARSQVAASRT